MKFQIYTFLLTLCTTSFADHESAVSAIVKEEPQKSMTLKNGYHPGLYPFNKGEPFIIDPNVGSIDFNTKSPNQKSEEYYDYDTKLEEVPYDYKGDPIDRKDVGDINLPRPNEITLANNKNKQTDIYQFLNLPVKYSSSDKFPLMSSSYANTKVQGAGSSLSNHKILQIPSSTLASTTRYTTLKTTPKTTTETQTKITSTITTTTQKSYSEYEEESSYDYDYYHPQESISETTSNVVTSSTSTSNPSSTTVQNKTPIIATESTTMYKINTSTTTPLVEASIYSMSFFPNKTATTTTTTLRPEIDSKHDGASFPDFDSVKSTEKNDQVHSQTFKPISVNNKFNEKTYPLMTNNKNPMTFTAHVSSGISLNNKEHEIIHPSDLKSPQVKEELAYSIKNQNFNTSKEILIDPTRLISNNKHDIIPGSLDSNYQKVQQHKVVSSDQPEMLFYKVKPNTSSFPNAGFVLNRPQGPQIVSHPYQPELPLVKTTPEELKKKPSNTEIYQNHPYIYNVAESERYHKLKPQSIVSQSQPDTSKFKPPKHVINHFIKTQPNEDNKSYALQTSFSIGMAGERTDNRPGQGIGQVLMVEDSSLESKVNQSVPVKFKSPTPTSVPLIPPSRLTLKPDGGFPRPQWGNLQKPSPYYPPPKREGPPPTPPQRTNLPNILPQFRPNAKVDSLPLPPQHAASIERVQIPMDHLRPPPLPKPQFLRLERNDEDMGEEKLDVPEKETRILHTNGPPPAKVTTLQMIQQGSSPKIQEDNKEKPVHIIYATNNSPKPLIDKLLDDPIIIDSKDRSDVPILKSKNVNKPIKTDFPYQIIKPDETQNISSLDYNAFSPTKPDTTKPNNDQGLLPNLQDYVPMSTHSSGSIFVTPPKPITATLKTTEDNHKNINEGNQPPLQNFQIPFQPSLKIPENSNGWSVIRKSQVDASEKIDEFDDVVAPTEKFDPDKFKPQLVGGFMPISLHQEESIEKEVYEKSDKTKE
ncbi:uncharacterized protein LOC126901100 [Daktulosphaira vitifoliae]|uniref:uncharacterized protein LOC126901100 n=1 Tax=Daktulosphaira vitifoliae TaxID=58002 RepID=UPI0021A9AF85|nr:uncharacterized protein LOC126901100 [Daktulosphaira vitifoliae]